jgi:hypothetical protein
MADTTFYARLKKLFSSGVIVRNVGGKKLKVADTDNLQATMSGAMRERYSRIHAMGGYGASPASSYAMNMAYQAQRIMLFRDYDVMDMDSIIHSALDIYADESTVRNEYGRTLTIECDNTEIKEILENLYYDILNIDFNLYMWIRSLCKYGDLFLFLEIGPEYCIHNVVPLSVYDTVRLEGTDPKNPYYVCFETMGAAGSKQRLENFEIAHFRLIGDPNFLPYGKSTLEGGRRVYRQLMLMEDAMLIHRIMRAPDKRIFKIDIGNIPPGEVDNFIQRLMDKTKKIPFIDPGTGDYNLRYNMQNLLEDFYIPVRGADSGTSIENLGGLEYNAIDDIQYLLNRLMASLKIPKAFLGYEEGISGKLTLASEDVRFARTIERIQRIVESELYKIGVIHLYSQGYKDEDLVAFKLSLTTPSTIYEQEKINLWKEKVILARDIIDSKLLSTEWVYENVFNISRDDYQKERELIVEDVKRTFRYQQIEQGQSDPARFGFPQDQEPPELPPEGEPGAPGAPAPSSGAPAPVGEDTEVGRPEKGISYGQDSYPNGGRDPLGFAGRYHAIGQKQDREQPKKFPLSFESRQYTTLFSKMNANNKVRGAKRLLSEVSEQAQITESDAGTYLDENVLENIED